jgi:uncharacterized protein (DUF885 family)
MTMVLVLGIDVHFHASTVNVLSDIISHMHKTYYSMPKYTCAGKKQLLGSCQWLNKQFSHSMVPQWIKSLPCH